MNHPHSHCHFCGAEHTERGWPRTCPACKQVSYRNPLPVAVLLCDTARGLLLVDRAIAPYGLALPGGYIEVGEDWRDAARRELREETGYRLPDDTTVVSHDARSAPDGTVLIFGRTGRPLTAAETDTLTAAFQPSEETSALDFTGAAGFTADAVVFDLHRQVIADA